MSVNTAEFGDVNFIAQSGYVTHRITDIATERRKGERMRILFNLLTTIEIPDADEFPPKEEVERQLVDFLKSEGMIVHGLEVTNYCVPAEEAERRTDG